MHCNAVRYEAALKEGYEQWLCLCCMRAAPGQSARYPKKHTGADSVRRSCRGRVIDQRDDETNLP